MKVPHVSRPRILRGARISPGVQDPVIKTPRLLLRPHRLAHAEQWYAIQSVPEIERFMHWPDRDRDASFRHLCDRTRHTRLSQLDDFLALGIEHDGRLIGDVSLRLKSVRDADRSVEIAWILHPDHEGNGFATEAASAMLDLAFDSVRARWVTALIDLENVKSLAVAARLGMRRVPLDDSVVAFLSTAALRHSTIATRAS